MHNLVWLLTAFLICILAYTSLPTLRIFSLGDIVAGMNDVGSWSPLFINTPIVDQAVKGFDAIADFIHYYLARFDSIEFYGISGNHGRAAKDGVQKEHDNWDYVCHKFLETSFVIIQGSNFISLNHGGIWTTSGGITSSWCMVITSDPEVDSLLSDLGTSETRWLLLLGIP
jgi:hypothetical protein